VLPLSCNPEARLLESLYCITVIDSRQPRHVSSPLQPRGRLRPSTIRRERRSTP
jgi:hypothetical protein